MGSVSVNQPKRADSRRGAGQRAFLWGLRLVLPPSRDNQRAADFLAHEVGPADPHLQWVVVRPDTLEEGDVGEYVVHDAIVSSLFRPDHTRMANVAHFMCELVTDDTTWERWRSRMPVVVDAEPAEETGDAAERKGECVMTEQMTTMTDQLSVKVSPSVDDSGHREHRGRGHRGRRALHHRDHRGRPEQGRPVDVSAAPLTRSPRRPRIRRLW